MALKGFHSIYPSDISSGIVCPSVSRPVCQVPIKLFKKTCYISQDYGNEVEADGVKVSMVKLTPPKAVAERSISRGYESCQDTAEGRNGKGGRILTAIKGCYFEERYSTYGLTKNVNRTSLSLPT